VCDIAGEPLPGWRRLAGRAVNLGRSNDDLACSHSVAAHFRPSLFRAAMRRNGRGSSCEWVVPPGCDLRAVGTWRAGATAKNLAEVGPLKPRERNRRNDFVSRLFAGQRRHTGYDEAGAHSVHGRRVLLLRPAHPDPPTGRGTVDRAQPAPTATGRNTRPCIKLNLWFLMREPCSLAGEPSDVAHRRGPPRHN